MPPGYCSCGPAKHWGMLGTTPKFTNGWKTILSLIVKLPAPGWHQCCNDVTNGVRVTRLAEPSVSARTCHRHYGRSRVIRGTWCFRKKLDIFNMGTCGTHQDLRRTYAARSETAFFRFFVINAAGSTEHCKCLIYTLSFLLRFASFVSLRRR